jgi:hypothetical protein
MIYKILHRKLKIELHEPHLKRELRPSKWKLFVAQDLPIDTKIPENERKSQSICNMKPYRLLLENPEIFS